MNAISRITINGFKSIQVLDQFELRGLNVLIGANGSGKSNFIGFFRMLHELVEQRLQLWTRKQGGADRIVSFGVKQTAAVSLRIRFGKNEYDATLEPTAEGGFVFANEKLVFDGPYYGKTRSDLGSGHQESNLKEQKQSGSATTTVAKYCYTAISGWKVYHFHDTSATAGMKRLGALHDNEYLRADASNLAAFLYRLQREHADSYQQIRKVVQLAIPFFDDFVLKPKTLPSEEQQLRLLWQQRDSDYAFWPDQLSDGSIRFICLATALLQPEPPSMIIIDEPELGLHPYAISLLASLLRSASKRMQVIVSTQSVPLVNEFAIEDLVVIERENNASVFRRYQESEIQEWLEEYSVGELWEKNILGGRPKP